MTISSARRNLLAAAVSQAVLFSANVQAATIVVNDPSGGSSMTRCTLPDALDSANLDMPIGGCAGGSGRDIIEFALGASDNVIPVVNELRVDSEIEIRGPGADRLTLDGQANSRVIIAPENLTLSNVTVSNGMTADCGGGIYANTATLTGVTVTGNTAATGGGVCSRRSLTVRDSRVENNTATSGSGGGLYASGGSLAAGTTPALTIVDSVVSGNSAADGGGGIYSAHGPALIERVAVVDNNASGGDPFGGAGGLFLNQRIAGPIEQIPNNMRRASRSAPAGTHSTRSTNNPCAAGQCAHAASPNTSSSGASDRGPVLATATIINSTISGNTATGVNAGGGIDGNQPVVIAHSTVAANSGTKAAVSISSGTLINSIVADNMSSIGVADCNGAYNSVTADSFNIIETSSDCGNGRQIDPGLVGRSPVYMRTFHSLRSSSPARNAGGPCIATDQRGVPRDDGQCDTGATEFTPTTTTVTTLDGGFGRDGLCSLIEATFSANDGAALFDDAGECPRGLDQTTIAFDPGITPGEIRLDDRQLQLAAPIILRGDTDDAVTIVGAPDRRVILASDFLDSNVEIEISHLTITGGAADSGGGIRNFEDMTLNAVTVSGNSASSLGGGIASDGGLALFNSTVSGNTADGFGGGIFARNSGLAVWNTTIAANESSPEANLSTYTNTTTLLVNSIIADGIGGVDCFVGGQGATLQASANNIIEDGTCATDALQVDPDLGPLAANGGVTFTHALRSGSIAIDAGAPPFCITTILDQTGMDRSIDGDGDGASVCDLGAFEFIDSFAPMASLDPVSDILAESGNPQSIVITYTDADSQMSAGSFDVNDIVVVGPGDPLNPGSLTVDANTATYLINPPGGSWDAADNGDYTVRMVGGQVLDNADPSPNAVPAGDLGSFAVDIFVQDVTPPTASLSSAPDVLSDGGMTYQLTINYTDADSGMDAASYDVDDISVTGPAGALPVAGISASGDSVTYTLTPPGGSWAFSDNGQYSISINADEVFDTATPTPNAAAAGPIGSFDVFIPEPNPDEIFRNGFES